MHLRNATKRVGFVAFGVFLLASASRAAENLSPLGKSPDWPALERFQETITRDEFSRLLERVYCTRGVSDSLIRVDAESAQFLIDKDEQRWFTLRFAKDESSAQLPAHRWKTARSLRPASQGRELAGLKIALDPGHIGGT
ncbi:MAG: hypothetical protein ABR589_10750 [Chthoniobacterales bacterium]